MEASTVGLQYLCRVSSEWNNKSPRDRSGSPQASEGISSLLPRSVSLLESLDTRHRLLELGPSSSEYRPELPVRRPVGEKLHSLEGQELLESPSNLYANLGEEIKPSRGVTPVTMGKCCVLFLVLFEWYVPVDTVSIPPTVVSEETRYSLLHANKRDSVYNNLLFAQVSAV